MSWTDERVELLTKLWGEGKTAAEIASTLGGVTRNAVIGKAHRLKLSGRVSPIQQNKKPAAPKPVVAVSNASPKTEPKVITSEHSGNKIALIDLKARDCRWPTGDPKEDDFGFCGEETVSGLPYCSAHCQLAYQAATRNRILKAEELIEQAAKEVQANDKSAKPEGGQKVARKAARS